MNAEYYRKYREKNAIKRRAYEAIYREKNRKVINNRQQEYRKTLKYKYADQKQAASQRNISWNFIYKTWLDIWETSGHLSERGITGYHMCRKGDDGAYSPDNVYIAHHTENRRDAYNNGKSWLAQQHS